MSEWIKVETALPDKPEVQYIAGIINQDADSVVGKLIRVWSWFDKHTTDGNAVGVTFAFVDRLVGVTGFAEAMQFAGWLVQRDKVLHMPNFDNHNSESAKKRALTQKRQSRFRNADSNAPVTQRASPDKIREEVNTSRGKSTIPDGWKPKPETLQALSLELKGADVAAYVEPFRDQCRAKDYRYKDFEAAFRNCVRQDWPKLRAGGVVPFKRADGLAL